MFLDLQTSVELGLKPRFCGKQNRVWLSQCFPFCTPLPRILRTSGEHETDQNVYFGLNLHISQAQREQFFWMCSTKKLTPTKSKKF
jgi:hypothetical protein